MKRKLSLLLGNLLMVVGMLLMVGSMAFTVGVLIFALPLPDIYSEASLMGIFIGALVWLGGAGLSAGVVNPLRINITGCVISTAATAAGCRKRNIIVNG
ncbi:DUF2583 family protein [Morganella morganii]|uniref:DUF2583 family protein n=1 Tax=Morganella morganii TaxID=582 RepID=UPI001F611A8E|nr:DUF2583 family protein [Morganella morganii]